MIPELKNSGNLPNGIHSASLVEFEARFSISIKRKKLFEGLLMLIEDLRKIGCIAIYVDGSYVTNKRLPNDIDVCWEDENLDYNIVERELPILFDLDYPRIAQKNKYNCDIFPAHYEASSSKTYFIDFFQIDKETNALKGVIKIEL